MWWIIGGGILALATLVGWLIYKEVSRCLWHQEEFEETAD